ncbi:MAG: hypothetical protein ACKOBT_14310, partial [Actinomycetota bacterium]
MFKPDAKAFYRFLSQECRDTVTVGDLTFALAFGGMFLEGMAGTKMSEFRVGDVEIRSLTSSSAEARYAVVLADGSVFADLEDSEWSGWVYEDGGWKTTDCEDFADAGDFGESGSAFGGPDCSLLVDGQPVPGEFRDESSGDIDLTCTSNDETQIAASTSCFDSDREYSASNEGYAFFDDGIYRSGDVRGCLPPCSSLTAGQQVPEQFSEESRMGFNLECEDDFGDPVFAMTSDCWDSDRSYIQNEFGYAFLDDRIYRTGEVVGCLPQCSRLTPGQPVPDIFNDTSKEGFNLNCEDPNGNPYSSYTWDCWDSNREYVQMETGYAFVDDRIFRAG